MLQFSPPLHRAKLPQQRWQIAAVQPEAAQAIAQTTGLSPLLSQVMINRGLKTPEQVQTYLKPELQQLPTPLEEFPDLALSLELLEQAILNQQKIAICGDYDADGMTSTALLLRALRQLGAQIDYAIPSRMRDGYGLNQRIVEEFHAEGVRLILTVDNGIAAVQPIARARELGLNVIITDHHDLPAELPPANAILNPKLLPEMSPYRGLAGVGVAYVLAISLARQMQRAQGLANPLLELFTLGTIADLAPLTGVNRRWVKRGLELLPQSQLTGIQALIQVAGQSSSKALKPEAIGFGLGPRINAVGRIADPQTVIELLTTEDEGVALERAMQCEQINQQRQQLCQTIEQEAIALYEASNFDLREERVLVLVHPGWHHGVIGIVASRLVERYGVPVFIGTYEDEAKEYIRGSARSIPEFDVFGALEFSKDLLEKSGGHRAAGGFTLRAEQLDAWRSRLISYARTCLEPQYLKPLIKVDVQANFNQINLDLYQQIDALHPCGIENPDPVFWTGNVCIVDQKVVGNKHLKLTLSQTQTEPQETTRISAIAWRWSEYFPLPSSLDVAYKLRVNEWEGHTTVELELIGARAATRMSSPLGNPTTASTKAEFYYQARRYTCQQCTSNLDHNRDLSGEKELTTTAFVGQLRICNDAGDELVIEPGQALGQLHKNERVSPVDISTPHFQTLMQFALQALACTIHQ